MKLTPGQRRAHRQLEQDRHAVLLSTALSRLGAFIQGLGREVPHAGDRLNANDESVLEAYKREPDQSFAYLVHHEMDSPEFMAQFAASTMRLLYNGALMPTSIDQRIASWFFRTATEKEQQRFEKARARALGVQLPALSGGVTPRKQT